MCRVVLPRDDSSARATPKHSVPRGPSSRGDCRLWRSAGTRAVPRGKTGLRTIPQSGGPGCPGGSATGEEEALVSAAGGPPRGASFVGSDGVPGHPPRAAGEGSVLASKQGEGVHAQGDGNPGEAEGLRVHRSSPQERGGPDPSGGHWEGGTVLGPTGGWRCSPGPSPRRISPRSPPEGNCCFPKRPSSRSLPPGSGRNTPRTSFAFLARTSPLLPLNKRGARKSGPPAPFFLPRGTG